MPRNNSDLLFITKDIAEKIGKLEGRNCEGFKTIHSKLNKIDDKLRVQNNTIAKIKVKQADIRFLESFFRDNSELKRNFKVFGFEICKSLLTSSKFL